MTGNQTTCGRFFSSQNGCSKKNWTIIHLLSLTPVPQKLTHAHTQRVEVQSELALSVSAVFE
jgi:hypothetical protein